MVTSTSILAIFLAVLPLSSCLPTKDLSIIKRAKNIFSRKPLNRRGTQAQYVEYAVEASKAMQQDWYDTSTGLWNGSWWNSANAITTLADFQDHFNGSIGSVTSTVFPNTLKQAPLAPQFNYTGFINGFYDDELWWALAWIRVWDVTPEDDPMRNQYLDTAKSIFNDAKVSWGSSNCKALWWDKAHSGTNAVENELYITAAAKLAIRSPSDPSDGYYYNEAWRAFTWFNSSGLINNQNLIYDHLNANCQNNQSDPQNLVWTYNQGIILSGLTEMAWAANATEAAALNYQANQIAMAGIDHFTDSNGILHEVCEPNCGTDGDQFKGVFGRNIQWMVNRGNDMPDANKQRYINFLKTNADSIWSNDRDNVTDQLGLNWSGPNGTATFETQSSALDAIVGAACVTS